ncbi:MAG: phosphoenolpyruvate carboxylase, partial [Spirochaetia bacterium]|nr:phosphoenolpyruvate carboxylase [Spirochaetia bacterium]
VVLFDALEDSAFPEITDLDGAGSLKDLFTKVESAGKMDEYRKHLAEFKVRIVLTAHPTQFYPDEVLLIITDLASAVKENRIPEINDLLLQMGKTRFKNKVKPTPLDEAKSILWFLENVFYDTLPGIQQRLATEALGSEPPGIDLDPKIELGFWPGGDRDGNPFVTASITLATAELLKGSILRLYQKDFKSLLRRLTFDGVIESMESIQARLDRTITQSGSGDRYHSTEELISHLLVVRKMLVESHGGLFLEKLDLFLYKLRLFGFHFATIDLRQDSRIHGQVLDALFPVLTSSAKSPELAKALAGYAEKDEPARRAALIQAAGFLPEYPSIETGIPEGIVLDTVQSLRAAQVIQKENGERGLHRYIISNTQSALNLIEVWFLARLAGWKEDALTLDIVPLFETVEDLENADRIMEELYTFPAYQKHLKGRGQVQTIMLGFSDGTKDGGYVTANWGIFKAKERLTAISRKYGVRVIFFDGRGGPPSRGGGNTHKFYRSLGSRIEHREIQLTIQGQTVSSKYGTPHSCRYNMEQLISAGLELHLFPDPGSDLTPEDMNLMDLLSDKSKEAYLKFRHDGMFLPYLQEMTPLEFYGQTNIGSRPSKRGKSNELRFEDLRAIPFVGAWSQMKQNIPGYFGFGTGLEYLIKKGDKGKLQHLFQNSLFFRTLVENTMQSLSKCFFPLTYSMEKDPKFGEFWKWIYGEAATTKELLKEISSQTVLLESDPVNRESIHLRERMVLPLLVIQQYGLAMIKEIRKNPAVFPPEALDTCQKIVIKSLAANINASRNSA